ncbi:tRNA (guanosine(37)-N1)-methyltransferase TrmD [Buchnera aphidicola (Taiwanaphis decaspermi)]|uniref:tRNA (guanosine(37)-N1)-methyltransferase TrmD n=1 Tax=Buchnera aphidicola TaxID=9 RepID=UPI0031B85114
MSVLNKKKIIFNIITIFPNMFKAITKYGITKKAIKEGFININIFNLRNFSNKKNKNVDDRPYGGGAGMLMSIEPIVNAINHIKKKKNIKTKVIYLSPQGKLLNQNEITKISNYKNLIIICGRYEGIDERIIKYEIDEEWSIGDYILSGGELPAMILLDALIRLIPGVVSKKESVKNESFSKTGLLDYPSYTRPKNFNNMLVPKVLLSGHHEKIRKWRIKQSLNNTLIKRPKLIVFKNLNEEQKKYYFKLKKNNIFIKKNRKKYE